MTTKETVKKMQDSVLKIKEKKHFKYLTSLLSRWENEKEHEGWDSYEKAIKKELNYLDIIKVTKRPFGIQYNVQDMIVIIAFLKKSNKLELKISYKHNNKFKKLNNEQPTRNR